MAIFRLKPKNDFVFGRLFGTLESKPSLLALLNAILRGDGQEPIVDLSIVENRQLEKLTFDEKTGILDVRAVLASGEQVNIEMQMVNRRNMVERSLFYMAKLFISSIRAGDNYEKLKKTIVINLLDYELPHTQRYHSCFHFYEDHDRSLLLSDLLEVHAIEFPKFERAAKDMSIPLHRWLMFMDEKLPEERLKELMRMDPMIEVTEEQLQGMSRDEFMRRAAEIREKAQMDWISSIEGAKKEGREENQAEVVAKLIAKGLDARQVSELLDIPLAKIEDLIAKSEARQ